MKPSTDPRSDEPGKTRRSRRCWRRTARGHRARAARRPQLWLAPLRRHPSLISSKWTSNEFPSRDNSSPGRRPCSPCALCGCATVSADEPHAVVAAREPLGDLHVHAAGRRRSRIPRSSPDSIAPTSSSAPREPRHEEERRLAQIFEFDYKLPAFQNDIGYYYLVDYTTQNAARQAPPGLHRTVQHAAIVSRYVLSLEVNRGPVGARIGVLGRGFTPQDLIGFDGTPVRTVYESPTSLGFFVPALTPGKTYRSRFRAPRATRRRHLPDRLERRDGGPAVAHARARPEADPHLHDRQPGARGRPPPGRHDRRARERDHARGGRARGPDLGHRHGRGRQAGHGSLFLKGYGNGEVTVPVTVGPAK
jgi:hypothetical protein